MTFSAARAMQFLDTMAAVTKKEPAPLYDATTPFPENVTGDLLVKFACEFKTNKKPCESIALVEAKLQGWEVATDLVEGSESERLDELSVVLEMAQLMETKLLQNTDETLIHLLGELRGGATPAHRYKRKSLVRFIITEVLGDTDTDTDTDTDN